MTCPGLRYKQPPNAGAMFPVCLACGNLKMTSNEKPPRGVTPANCWQRRVWP